MRTVPSSGHEAILTDARPLDAEDHDVVGLAEAGGALGHRVEDAVQIGRAMRR